MTAKNNVSKKNSGPLQTEAAEAYNESYAVIDEQRKIWAKIPTFGFLKSPLYDDLSVADFRVLLYLLGRVRGGSMYGWNEATAFSITSLQIAYGTTLHKRTVDKALQRLKEHKLIDWVQTKSHGYIGPRKIYIRTDRVYEISKEDLNDFYSAEGVRQITENPAPSRPPLNRSYESLKPTLKDYEEDLFGSEAEKVKKKPTSVPSPSPAPAPQSSSPDSASSKLKAQGVDF